MAQTILVLKKGRDRAGFMRDLRQAGLTWRPVRGLPRHFVVDGVAPADFPLRDHPAIASIDDGEETVTQAAPAQSLTIDVRMAGGSWPIARHIRRRAPWNVERIRHPIQTYFRSERTGDGVDIYVIDNGILTAHGEFGGRATNVYAPFANPPTDGHGSAVAAMAVGATVGIAREALVWSFQWAAGQSGFATHIVDALGEALSHYQSRASTNRPAIVNCSFGTSSSTVGAAVADMIDEGMVVTAAAHNQMQDLGTITMIPAQTDDVICVGGVSANDRPYYTRFPGHPGSNWGTRVDVSAGAQSMRSIWLTLGAYSQIDSGTSFATGYASGVVACMLQGMDRLTTRAQVQAIRTAIRDNATTGRIRNAFGIVLPDRLLYLDPGEGEGPAAPGTPVIFPAATGTTELTVTHTTPGSDADHHAVYISDDAADLTLPIDPGFLVADELGPTPDPVVAGGLTPGTQYYVRSIASNGEGETASAIVTATTPEVGPARPTVTVPAKTDTVALLRSSDFAHSDGAVTIAAIEFRVATGTDPDTYVYSSDILAAAGDVLTWRDHGVEDLTAATAHNAFVRHWGTDGVASEWSLPTAFTTDADPPPVVDPPEITVEEQPGAFEWYYGASVEVEASVPHDPAIVLYQWFLFAGTEASPGPLLAWTYSTSRIWRAVVYEGPGTYHVRVSPNLNAGPVADFSVGSRVLAPRITAPDGQAVELGSTIDIEWAALWGAPSGALVDIEVRASGGAWSEVASGLDADDGEYEWDISALPAGFYQLRIRMRTDTETSSWRTGYVLTIGEIPNLVEAPGDSLEDYEEGGVTGGVAWSADPIRSTLVVPNSQTHWQKYLPTGQPRDVEITAQVQSRAWHPSTYWAWQFNAIRHVGVGAQLTGTHESDEGALTGIWALLSGGGWAVPLDSLFSGARGMDRIYGRGAASVALTRRGTGLGGNAGTSIGHVHQWRPNPNPITGVIVDPWYQVRIRLTTTAVHESGARDYRARVQVAGPDIEPDGPDDWQIDATLTDVDIDCGEAGLVAWMANHLNPDVQALFRAVRIIPLDYGECVGARFDVDVDCLDVMLTADAGVLLTAVRYRITTADDTSFASPIVDTGFIDPGYIGTEGSITTAYLIQALPAGSYIALIDIEFDSQVETSDPLPFTVLHLAIGFWGGWANHAVTS